MRVWNIKALTDILGPQTSKHLLFLQAVLGCDTSSRLYGVGKSVSLKKFLKNDDLKKVALVFHNEILHRKRSQRQENTHWISFYNGSRDEKLDILRYRRFCEKVSTSKNHIKPQTLPPTSVAAKYHSRRVFFQIQQWKSLTCNVVPEQWGWKIKDDVLFPKRTDLPPALEDPLRSIRCNCMTDCSTMKCSCQKKNSLDCSAAYGQCRGSRCANSVTQMSDDDDDDDCPDTWVSLLMCYC